MPGDGGSSVKSTSEPSKSDLKATWTTRGMRLTLLLKTLFSQLPYVALLALGLLLTSLNTPSPSPSKAPLDKLVF